MRKTKTKGFGYDPVKDKAVIDYIDQQQNKSKYILDLVRQDMKKNDIEEIVKRQVEKYLQGCELQAGKKEKGIEIDANEINNILNL